MGLAKSLIGPALAGALLSVCPALADGVDDARDWLREIEGVATTVRTAMQPSPDPDRRTFPVETLRTQRAVVQSLTGQVIRWPFGMVGGDVQAACRSAAEELGQTIDAILAGNADRLRYRQSLYNTARNDCSARLRQG